MTLYETIDIDEIYKEYDNLEQKHIKNKRKTKQAKQTYKLNDTDLTHNKQNHPFIISEKSTYNNILEETIKLAKNYPYLNAQLKNSPFLQNNINNERIEVSIKKLKDCIGLFLTTQKSQKQYIYTIEIDKDYIQKFTSPNDDILQDLTHEYIHAIQQHLLFDYDAKFGLQSYMYSCFPSYILYF